ncbi:MAG: response regulator [Verrucomicrobium sp.]|nr:response regulator [Verrucomicrobium sp.]
MEILVVDDSNIARRLTSQLLRSLGHRSDAAESAEEAISLVAKKGYDIIFLDLHMPGMGGLEAMAAILKKVRKNRPPPAVVALTAENSEAQRQACLAAGMAGFLTKPCRRDEMSRVIEACQKHEDVSAFRPGLRPAEGGWTHEPFLRAGTVEALKRLPGENGGSLLPEMIAALEKDTPKTARQIGVLLRARSWKAAREGLHKLIGNFEVIGSPRLAAFCRACSAHVKDAEGGKRGAGPAVRRLWNDFSNEFAALKDTLRRDG